LLSNKTVTELGNSSSYLRTAKLSYDGLYLYIAMENGLSIMDISTTNVTVKNYI
jgi:hypothetical protein